MELGRNSGYLFLENRHGPFDIIGDVHGCFDELLDLLAKLGYAVQPEKPKGNYKVSHEKNHTAVFVGDLVDRGPNSPEVVRLVMNMIKQGVGYCVSGNHDDKLYRKLIGRNVQVRHGLELTMEQLSRYDKKFIQDIRAFLGSLPHHILLDEGRLVIAHAGLAGHLHGKHGKNIRDLCLYGPTT